MKQSVRAALHNSVEDYRTKARTAWVINHPGQCVLNGSQIIWTMEVEESISKGVEGVKSYFDMLQNQLNDLVDLVRKKLTKQQQVTLNALIVIDVHAKDVVDRLIKENVKEIGAFEWIMQLRYYWEEDNCLVTRRFGCGFHGFTAFTASQLSQLHGFHSFTASLLSRLHCFHGCTAFTAALLSCLRPLLWLRPLLRL